MRTSGHSSMPCAAGNEPKGLSFTAAFSIDSYHNTYGREVPYAALQDTKAGEWLRANPHRLDLARVVFVIKKADGSTVKPSDVAG